MCGTQYPIVPVLVRDLEPGETSEYWAWWSNKFMFVYPGKVCVDICFPYGPEVLEKAGEGIRVNVAIDVLEGCK